MPDTAPTAIAKPRRHSNFRPKVLVLFGTRPEAIKMAPVIRALRSRHLETLVVSSSQHKSLLTPFLKTLSIKVDVDLSVMKRGQNPNDVCSRVVAKLDKVIASEDPDLILVQGDTTTTLAGSLAAFNRRIPIGHIEAGLRSGDLTSPFPEEMNRRLVSQMATFHFAATQQNRLNLLAEGIAADRIFVTGNPVVDSLKQMLKSLETSSKIRKLIEQTKGTKRILLTTHRRESFGEQMGGNLQVLRDFVAEREDVSLIFPVHPNPNVKSVSESILGNCPRIHLLEPLDYSDFLSLMKLSWLIVSDSGGVQEEAPSLGKPLFVIRENTERPEAISSGVAKLVGDKRGALKALLERNYSNDNWIRSVRKVANPFGDGRSAQRIVKIIAEKLPVKGTA